MTDRQVDRQTGEEDDGLSPAAAVLPARSRPHLHHAEPAGRVPAPQVPYSVLVHLPIYYKVLYRQFNYMHIRTAFRGGFLFLCGRIS